MKNVLLWTNCQGGAIIGMLNKYHSDKYTTKHFLNYEYIREHKTLPEEFKDADIFIYQNYNSDKHVKDYDLDHIINNVLKPECKTICIPFLYFEAMFPYNTRQQSSNNFRTVSPESPFGRCFFGIGLIDDIMSGLDIKNFSDNDKETLIESICQDLVSENKVTEDEMKKYHDRSFEYLENKIMSGDLPFLLDYIKTNFTKTRLWHNPNHPSGELMKELVRGVFGILELDFNYDNDDLSAFNGLKDWEMPILPCVKKYYNLTFDDSCLSIYDPSIVDKKTFIRQYVKWMYFDFI